MSFLVSSPFPVTLKLSANLVNKKSSSFLLLWWRCTQQCSLCYVYKVCEALQALLKDWGPVFGFHWEIKCHGSCVHKSYEARSPSQRFTWCPWHFISHWKQKHYTSILIFILCNKITLQNAFIVRFISCNPPSQHYRSVSDDPCLFHWVL